jgi:hypothetical protein
MALGQADFRRASIGSAIETWLPGAPVTNPPDRGCGRQSYASIFVVVAKK